MSLPIWSLMIHSFISNHPGYSLIQGFFFSFLISLFLYFGISFYYLLSFLLFPFFSLVIWLSKVKLCWKCSVTAQTFFSYLRQKHNLQITFSWNIFSLSSLNIFSETIIVFKLLWNWAKSETLLMHYTCSLKKVSLKNVSCIIWWQPAVVLHCFLFSRLNCLTF